MTEISRDQGSLPQTSAAKDHTQHVKQRLHGNRRMGSSKSSKKISDYNLRVPPQTAPTQASPNQSDFAEPYLEIDEGVDSYGENYLLLDDCTIEP